MGGALWGRALGGTARPAVTGGPVPRGPGPTAPDPIRSVALEGGCAIMRVVWQVGRERLELREAPTPEPGPGEVLVRIAASALCGSELGAYRQEREARNGGHEAAGVVVALGAGCTALRRGDRVGICAVQGCGTCAPCRQGRYTYCERRVGLSGLHAEYAVSRELGCQPLPADVPWDVGVLLSGDGLGVPHHVSLRLGHRSLSGALVAVFGVGPVGLGNVLLQSRLGAEVVAVDVSAYRLDLARRLGAGTLVRAPTGPAAPEDLAAQVRQACGRAPDICLECTGRQPALLAALEAVGTAGTVVCIGEQGPAPISPSEHLIRRDITLMGSWFYHFSEYAQMLDLYRAGCPVGDLITHTYPLSDVQEAFAQFAAARTGKVILHPWPEEAASTIGAAGRP